MENEQPGEEVRVIPEFKIKYSDVFHLKNLYIMMHEYLVEEGWTTDDAGTSGPGDVHRAIESMYLEKHIQKGLHRGGTEMWVYWRMFKFYRRRSPAYFMNWLEIDFHMVYIQEQEVIHQGKKMKVQKGEIEIFFRPKILMEKGTKMLAKDSKGKFLSPFFAYFQDIFVKRIFNQEIDKREKELYRAAYQLQNIVKKYFNLRTFVPVPEPFHPTKYGYGFPENHPQNS